MIKFSLEFSKFSGQFEHNGGKKGGNSQKKKKKYQTGNFVMPTRVGTRVGRNILLGSEVEGKISSLPSSLSHLVRHVSHISTWSGNAASSIAPPSPHPQPLPHPHYLLRAFSLSPPSRANYFTPPLIPLYIALIFIFLNFSFFQMETRIFVCKTTGIMGLISRPNRTKETKFIHSCLVSLFSLIHTQYTYVYKYLESVITGLDQSQPLKL